MQELNDISAMLPRGTQAKLARKYNLSRAAVNKIAKGLNFNMQVRDEMLTAILQLREQSEKEKKILA